MPIQRGELVVGPSNDYYGKNAAGQYELAYAKPNMRYLGESLGGMGEALPAGAHHTDFYLESDPARPADAARYTYQDGRSTLIGDVIVPGFLTSLAGLGATEVLGLGGGATAGAPGPMGEGALGSGLRVGSNAGSIMGAGGGEAIGLGTGITPGAYAGGMGTGALGTGIAPGASGAGTLGALANNSFNFSGAGMEAIGATPGAVPSVSTPPSVPSGGAPATGGTGLRAPGGAQLGTGGLGSAPAAPASIGGGAAPGVSGGVAGATGAGAGGSAAGGAAAAGAGTSFVDSLIKQMKDNALGLGLIGASTLAATNRQTPLPNEAQIQQLGAEAQGVARQLIQQYQSQTLSPGQQASLDQLANNTKNQLKQYFASIGQSDSTASAQALAQVDQSVLAMKQEMLDSALQQGLSAIGIAQGPLNTIAQYQLGQDQQLAQAFGNFATGAGLLFGRGAGQQQPAQSSVTAAPKITSVQ